MRINLKDFRQAHHLYQSNMAELLDMNQSTISRAELKGFLDLTYDQRKKLFEIYGEEDVRSFEIQRESQGESLSFEVSGNVNNGDVTQNNHVFSNDNVALSILARQTEMLSKVAETQTRLTEKIVDLMDKLSERL